MIKESGPFKLGMTLYRRRDDGTKQGALQVGVLVKMHQDPGCYNQSVHGPCLGGKSILWQGDTKPTYHYGQMWYEDCCGA